MVLMRMINVGVTNPPADYGRYCHLLPYSHLLGSFAHGRCYHCVPEIVTPKYRIPFNAKLRTVMAVASFVVQCIALYYFMHH